MLTIETKHNEVCMMVEDDGEGIPKDRREEVFVPFSRLDQSRTSKTGGFGLGLAITQAAVNRLVGALK
ncbi:ATP-binding protein [Vibrio atlanticus]|uniref:ATP-binding protein n=1 Tax=Vibrio atlanticus TaxID=693153 RepID=UPI003D1361A2